MLKYFNLNNSRVYASSLLRFSVFYLGCILNMKFILNAKDKNLCCFILDYIVLFCSYNGLQKVGNIAENCKWYNFCPDLGVTPRILFTQNRIFYREF